MTHAMLLNPMLGRLGQTRTMRDVLSTALADAVALNGAEMGNVQMIGPCGDLIIVAHTNTSPAFLRRLGHVRAGSGTVCERAARGGGLVCVPDISDDPACEGLVEFARTVPFTSVISSALTTSRGELVGVLSVHSRHRFMPSLLEQAAMQEYSVRLADRLAQGAADLRRTAHELATQAQPELVCGCA